MTSEQTVLMAMSQEIAALKSELAATKTLVETLDEYAHESNKVLLRMSLQNTQTLSLINEMRAANQPLAIDTESLQ